VRAMALPAVTASICQSVSCNGAPACATEANPNIDMLANAAHALFTRHPQEDKAR
jgi:hypothetical protein